MSGLFDDYREDGYRDDGYGGIHPCDVDRAIENGDLYKDLDGYYYDHEGNSYYEDGMLVKSVEITKKDRAESNLSIKSILSALIHRRK